MGAKLLNNTGGGGSVVALTGSVAVDQQNLVLSGNLEALATFSYLNFQPQSITGLENAPNLTLVAFSTHQLTQSTFGDIVQGLADNGAENGTLGLAGPGTYPVCPTGGTLTVTTATGVTPDVTGSYSTSEFMYSGRAVYVRGDSQYQIFDNGLGQQVLSDGLGGTPLWAGPTSDDPSGEYLHVGETEDAITVATDAGWAETAYVAGYLALIGMGWTVLYSHAGS